MADKLTEGAIYRVIEKHHAPKVWACFPQVKGGTGWTRRTRTADAMAMCLWPSRGLELHGFEIKCNRGDWLRELKAPEKADELAVFCDRWWIVTPPGIVERAELPPAWGLYEVEGAKLVQRVAAAKREEPKPLDRKFFAAMMRRAQEGFEAKTKDMIHRSEIRDEVESQRQVIEADAMRETRRLLDHAKHLRESVKAFEEASGVRMDHWNQYRAGRIGEAVRMVLDLKNRDMDVDRVIDRQIKLAERIAQQLRALKDSEGRTAA